MVQTRRRVSTVVVHQGKILGFHAKDPTSGQHYIFLPGGLIEEGESIDAAAIRETAEETGYSISVAHEPRVFKRYWFLWDGKDRLCETTFVKGTILSEQATPVDDASYHLGVVWTDLSQIKETFGYHADILNAIEEILT